MPASLKFRNQERFEGKGSKRIRPSVVVLFAILGVLLVFSFIFYVSRLSGSTGGSGSGDGDGQAYAQANMELTPPDNIRVTVDKGATINWDGLEDVRIIGYNVYRFDGEEDGGTKINAAIISDTVYHDDEGTMFNSYAVAPVDTNGRQGVVSIPIVAVAEPVSLTGLTPIANPQEVEDTTFKDYPTPAGLPADGVDCTADGMTYYGVWYLERYSVVTGGTLMVTPYYGDSCSYTFAGDSVTVISTMHWNYGIMDIYIDGELRKQVDLYSSELKPQERVFSASGLGPGAHTIKLVCTGHKNPQAYFTFVNLEALEIR